MSYTQASTCEPAERAALQHPRLWALMLASAALTCTATLAHAQTTTSDTATDAANLTVQAHRMVKHEIVGEHYVGTPIEKIQLTREVGYRDLNLSTPQGAHALKHRIRMTAEVACRQLSSLYPFSDWTTSNQSCVQMATKMGMDQVLTAVAAAEYGRLRPFHLIPASP